MRKIALTLACLYCGGYGRRVQGLVESNMLSEEVVSPIRQAKAADALQSEEVLARFLLGLSSSAAFNPSGAGVRSPLQNSLRAQRMLDAEMAIWADDSLAAKMWNDVSGGIKDIAEKAGLDLRSEEEKKKMEEENTAQRQSILKNMAVDRDTRDAEDLNARAAEGVVSFKDFITMAEAYSGLGGQDIPGMPTMSKKQKQELTDKFDKHRRMVDVMMEDELEDPNLLLGEVQDGTGPRLQRIARASGEMETEVAMFVMQFEAMRESTSRIAAGEDPDKVEQSNLVGANRKQKRLAKKQKAKLDKQKQKTKM